jgi:hypothetical protein
MDYPPESLDEWLDYIPEEDEQSERKTFLVPCRGAADGVCMISEDEYRKIWKEMHALVMKHGGFSPGPRPITKPGVYEFIWEDEEGRHVYEMWVRVKSR